MTSGVSQVLSRDLAKGVACSDGVSAAALIWGGLGWPGEGFPLCGRSGVRLACGRYG